jgi:hypothetical protein
MQRGVLFLLAATSQFSVLIRHLTGWDNGSVKTQTSKVPTQPTVYSPYCDHTITRVKPEFWMEFIIDIFTSAWHPASPIVLILKLIINHKRIINSIPQTRSCLQNACDQGRNVNKSTKTMSNIHEIHIIIFARTNASPNMVYCFPQAGSGKRDPCWDIPVVLLVELIDEYKTPS